MALLPIITAPDPRLKKVCDPVEAVDDEIRRLMDDMLETMYAAPGIGLAAPQVGVLKRVIVVDIAGDDEEKAPLYMANPELVAVSDDDAAYEDYGEVARPAKIRVRFLDRENEIREMEAEGLLATCIQHEMDHLDGILFVDHLTALKRNMILRKLLKAKKSNTPLASYATV